MSEIKNYMYPDINIPKKVVLNIEGVRVNIEYPFGGKVADVTEYVKLVLQLGLVSQEGLII